VMESARHMGLLKVLVTLVPATAFAAMLGTVISCLLMWRSGPVAIDTLVLPAISELGIDLPQRRVYQAGFAICAVLFSLCILCFEELLEPHLLTRSTSVLQPGAEVRVAGLTGMPSLNGTVGICQRLDETSGRWTVRLPAGDKALRRENLEVAGAVGSNGKAHLWPQCLQWGHAAAIGAGMQGVFTLEREISPRCFIHWGGAILFMAGAMQHAKASNELYDAALASQVPLLLECGVRRALRLRHLILDYSSVVVFGASLLMQVMPRSSSSSEEASSAIDLGTKASTKGAGGPDKMPFDSRTMNAMGLMQWAIIFQFAIYFCSYTFDMRAAVAAHSPLAAPASAPSDAPKKEQ